MEIKTWEQFGIWLGMQFPVVAVVVVVARWVLLYLDGRHTADLARTTEQYAVLLAEKDRQIADRDERIQQLEAEREKLMNLHFPSWNKGRPVDGGRQS